MEFDVARAVRAIEERSVVGRTTLAAIDGRSGVGKSTFAKRLARLREVAIIEGDDFYAAALDGTGPWDLQWHEAEDHYFGTIDRTSRVLRPDPGRLLLVRFELDEPAQDLTEPATRPPAVHLTAATIC